MKTRITVGRNEIRKIGTNPLACENSSAKHFRVCRRSADLELNSIQAYVVCVFIQSFCKRSRHKIFVNYKGKY